MSEIRDRLCKAAGSAGVLEMESMKKHTTFRIGGPASLFVAPETKEQICELVRICREEDFPFFILGNGSNLLVSDAGYDGLVLQLYRSFGRIEKMAGEGEKEVLLKAEAGVPLSILAKQALKEGLTGFEFAAGIPGTLGGAVRMNAGAYGGEMKDVLQTATVLTREGEIREVSKEELLLGYRTSAVEKNGWIVLEATISLPKGDPEKIRERMDELKQARLEKQPIELPSAGSTFKRPKGYFAGKLIEDAGLRGFTVGGAQVSEKHCGFVVNRQDATAAEVMELIAQVQSRVREAFQVELEPEIRLLGDFS